ncbi:MAG TPA: inositol monophosphatase family protein, partial [Leptospiraceae bacterium]|nr:inositol monophosphatase family protein [Leptospiraceae bacterium]
MHLQARLLQLRPTPNRLILSWKERKQILNFFQNSLPLFREIGEEIKSIYTSDYKVTWKKKDDPLTEADLFVHTAVKNFLIKKYPDIPLLSEEEDSSIDFSKVPEFFSLDPIDGTREFVNKNPEFAVSLGFVKNGCPILGIVYNPITDEFIYGKTGDGIGRIYLNQTVSKLSFRRNSSERKYRPDHILVSKSEHREGLYSDSFWKDQGNIVPKGSIAYKLALSALSESD